MGDNEEPCSIPTLMFCLSDINYTSLRIVVVSACIMTSVSVSRCMTYP